jgi:hypothetical protein
MDPVSWALLAALALALGAMWWRARGLRTPRVRKGRPVPLGPVLGSAGPARCAAAANVLDALAAVGDSEQIVDAWERLEGPLLEALPDCPPPLKTRLADALAACANACANRVTAQGLMTVRNSLV